MSNKRVEAIYSGTVQGVGFRFTARNLALKLNISGWVKNLGDGSVGVVAEGPEPVLKEFLSQLVGNFSGYVRNIDVNWQEATGEFTDFTIRF